jgi:hypothetical protein
MSLTYRAVQVTEPGKLELVNRPIPETPAGKSVSALKLAASVTPTEEPSITPFRD